MKTLSKTLVYRLALALGLLALAVPARAESDGGYGYVRVVEGSASVTQAGTSERASAEVNQPILAGDRISVANRSRLELVLADGNILRVDGGSDLILERLAASPDRDDRATVIRLLEGNVQLIVTRESLGDELPRIETPDASIYPQDYGVYRITADRDGWSRLVVRQGIAEVVADDGRSRVRADEELVIDRREDRDGDELAEAQEAGGYDSLERWARQLDDESSGVDMRYVDDNLRYQAAPLARYGEWIDYEGASYWRPRVEAGWRPFWRGRWVYLASGLTWVSSEPWGWVPYHYGSWDYLPAYGWAWRPGYVYSPAWVYWYWGPNYVGWCPTGFYTRYYASQFGFGLGFRYGVYGWAGGDWGYFDRWNFVTTSYFDYRQGYRHGYRDGYWDGRRDVQRYAVPTDRLRGGRTPLERGIITTDTKPLRPSTWQNPGAVANAFGRNARELPDVTPFIARKPLTPAVQRTVVAENPNALDGTPLRPGTLGKPRGNRAGREGVLGGSPGSTGNGNTGNSGGTVKPGRPAIEIGGGAPNPRNRDQQQGQPRDRSVRPSPEADGGAPRPDRRPVLDTKPGRTDRDDRSEGNERKPVLIPRPDRDRDEKPARQPERQPSNDDGRDRTERREPARSNDRPADRERPANDDRRPPETKDRPERRPPESQDQDRRPPAQLYRTPSSQADREQQPRAEPRPSPQVYRAPEPSRQAPRAEPQRSEPQRSEARPAPQKQEPQRSRDDDGGSQRRDHDRRPPG